MPLTATRTPGERVRLDYIAAPPVRPEPPGETLDAATVRAYRQRNLLARDQALFTSAPETLPRIETAEEALRQWSDPSSSGRHAAPPNPTREFLEWKNSAAAEVPEVGQKSSTLFRRFIKAFLRAGH